MNRLTGDHHSFGIHSLGSLSVGNNLGSMRKRRFNLFFWKMGWKWQSYCEAAKAKREGWLQIDLLPREFKALVTKCSCPHTVYECGTLFPLCWSADNPNKWGRNSQYRWCESKIRWLRFTSAMTEHSGSCSKISFPALHGSCWLHKRLMALSGPIIL